MTGSAPEVDPGEAVAAPLLDATIAEAAAAFGDRLLATYAIGSLSHGGFAPAVSDVDVVVLLRGPLGPEVPAAIDGVRSRLVARGLPLAARLSLFWAAVPEGDPTHERLEAIDRLDLIDSGRLLAGVDRRAELGRPTARDLARDTVRFVVGMFSDRVIAVMGQRLGPEDRRFATKAVLFPIRFLYTLRTGKVGRVEDAVADYVARTAAAAPGKVALVERALACRDGATPFDALLDRPSVVALYQEFEGECGRWLVDAGEPELAASFRGAMGRLRAQLG